MFEATATGKNRHYGEKGEQITIADNHILYALKHGWIQDNFKYVGSQARDSRGRLKSEVRLLPIKKINVETTLKQQNDTLNKLKERIDSLINVNNNILTLMKGGKNGSRK